ncbi:MAG: hypothetical protein U0441_10570 [Polyangiaceae bacterium]
MAHIVETAKSGRARCRTCGGVILKGELHLAEEAMDPAAGGATPYRHHLECAAKKAPSALRAALGTCPFPVPNRPLLERLIAENEPRQKPTTFPYAERAPSPKTHCGECHTVIAKGSLRVALHRENEGAIPMTPVTPRYYHAACVHSVIAGDPGVALGQIRTNSPGLTREDMDELTRALGPSRVHSPISLPPGRQGDPASF